MTTERYIIPELWREIKSFLFHDIKTQAKHLKDDPHTQEFNNVIKSMPGKYIPSSGPRIIYGSVTKPFRYAKYVYIVPGPRAVRYHLDIYKLIIEVLPFPGHEDEIGNINGVSSNVVMQDYRDNNAIPNLWY